MASKKTIVIEWLKSRIITKIGDEIHNQLTNIDPNMGSEWPWEMKCKYEKLIEKDINAFLKEKK